MQFSAALKQNHLFRRLYARGRSAANRNLVLYCRQNGQACNRVGYTISAKMGHAVARNRIRRQLREIYRLHEAQFRPGYDLVVVVRVRGMQASFQEITQAYLQLARKLELLRPEVGR